MTDFRGLFLSALAAAALIAGGVNFAAADDKATQSPAPAASPFIVHIKDFAFSPGVLKIPVGASVIWMNEDSVAHTVTASGKGGFNSKNLDGGKSFTFIFAKGGTYSYACSYHAIMTGTVVVGEGQPSPTPFVPPSPGGGYGY